MILPQDREELIKLKRRYSEIHNSLTNLAEETALLEAKRTVISQELDNTRKREKELINKIEQYTGEKVDQSVLLKIVNENGQ